MLLKSIQIQGFKSFADKTVLQFGKGITAVVGPNGSGKSNIADAVRWVLGEQSTKSLRGQSMEDVIFGGTDDRRPHGFCEVTLNIDNSDRSLSFDNDSIAITRRYYRSHESEYLINNIAVRLKDINELFMDTGLGRDGYSMIGQGKIDNIISTKSDERRDIFEEASGISKYRYRKIDAERKLSAAEENLIRLRDIMGELELRVDPLKEASEKAERFLSLADQKKQLEIGLWLYTLSNSKDALRAQESKIAAAQLRYNEIEEALSDFDAQNERNTTRFTEITAKIDEIRSNIVSKNEEAVKIDGGIAVTKKEIEHCNERINSLNSECEQLSLDDSSALVQINDKRENAERIKLEKESLEVKLSSLEKELSELLFDSENISRRIEEQAQKLNELTAKISDARVNMTTANTSIEEIRSRGAIVDELIEAADKKANEFYADFSETEKFLKECEDNIISSQNSIKGYRLRLESRRETAEKLKNELDNIHIEIETKRRRAQILTELQNNMEGFSKSVKAVIAESKKGILGGIHGTVSSLITVEKKYSIAIETALGNSIQNVIVDSEADAKRAIGYLKSSNLGRATFLPISTVKSREQGSNGAEDLFGFVGIASDLVKTDKKYSEIIKHLLAGTFVSEDIDSAIKIAKKFGHRVKVVSLDGQIVNPGGSLTGGSLVKQAGLLGRVADIDSLNSEIDKLTEKENNMKADYESLVSSLAEVNADILAAEADLKTANEDKIRTLAELKRIDDLRSENNANREGLIAERDNAADKIKELETLSNISSKQIEQIENEKKAIESEISEMSGGRDDISGKRDMLAESITQAKLLIVDREKDISSLLLSANELEGSISGRAERNKEIDNEISALTYKIDCFNEEIKTANDNIENIKIEIAEFNSEIDKLSAERNGIERMGVELRTGEKERISERERIVGEIARLSERKEVMMAEYDDVIRRLYDEYSLTRSEAEQIGIKIDKPNEAKRKLAEIKGSIRSLGNVNVSAIEEYKEVKERYDFMKEQVDDVESARVSLHKLINQLTSQMQELFVIGFDKINANFKKTFIELFGGGTANLKLTDPENILESGIDIEARLPGKNVPSLDGLSGGEKALVALAIYFSIMQVNSPPFCFLDEVDTALDDINVERFADYMRQSRFGTQFICVTHRRGTMEAADMLYGVTMQEKGVTKLLELNVAELEKKLLKNQGA
ncbi:MAG: chromosome segregation protein SMC [Clostridia bacterium]|nr:chromosome segregation protein SMC [Clostridia bacterium]